MLIDTIKKCKIALTLKIITSIMMCITSLLIPICWGKVVKHITNLSYNKAYFTIIISFLISSFYYFWSYVNQKAWYNYYSQLFINISSKYKNKKIAKINSGKFANIAYNDTDIICTFLGNLITRLIQLIEFIVILISFYLVNVKICIFALIIIIIMITCQILSGNKLQTYNQKKKKLLDKKLIKDLEMQEQIKNKEINLANNINVKTTQKYLESNYKFNVMSQGIIFLVLFIIDLSKYSIIIYTIHLFKNNIIDISSIVLIYTYYSKILTNFETLGTTNIEYQNFKISLNRIKKITI